MKARIALLLLLLSAAAVANEQPAAPRGSGLSLEVEKRIAKEGFTSSRIPLTDTSHDLFPFNITVDFPSQELSEAADARTNLIINIRQEDAWQKQEACADFLSKLEKHAYSYDITVLFTASDIPPQGLPKHKSGSGEYASMVSDTDHTVVIAVQLGKEYALGTGSYRRATPRWLLETLIRGLYAEKKSFSFQNAVTSFYRLGFIRAGERMEAFMAALIPAAELTIPENDDFSVLLAVCDHYQPLEETAFWDSHYLVLPFSYPILTPVIGERVFVILAIVLGTLAVLTLCVFSFSGSGAERQRRHFKRSWFMLPLTVLVLFLALSFGQTVAKNITSLQHATAMLQLGTKIFIALLVISLIFAGFELLKAPVESFVYGESGAYVAAGNIFFLSAIDLQFFLPLLIEYIIIYSVRKTMDLLPLILAVIAMFIPLIPYIYAVMTANNTEAIAALIFCGPGLNLLIALLFFPFQLMWLRILLWLKLFRHAERTITKRFIVHNALSLGILLLITTIVVTTLSLASRKVSESPERPATIVHRDNGSLNIQTSRTTFSDLTTEHVTITSAEGAVRYEMTLEAAGGAVPLYDASYNFTLNENATEARFDIPDYPPESMTVDYAFSSAAQSTLTITALYLTETAGVYRQETRTVSVDGGSRASGKKGGKAQ
ncbi:MAG: hypothetical protein K6G80_06520 [Treponema sp.]|nr:hypothetical protein [Treponema sp.]